MLSAMGALARLQVLPVAHGQEFMRLKGLWPPPDDNPELAL